jgi:hypothetical protein
MARQFDYLKRLELRTQDRDLQQGFAAPLRDPVWFLARQWQMGEHQGENATSPVLVRYRLATTPITAPAGAESVDLAVTPAESVVESELDDWWTMGRRIRLGRRVALAQAWLPGPAPADLPVTLRFHQPPPPYERFHEAFDGLALWQQRAALGIADDIFGTPSERPPAETVFAWQADQLHYTQTFPTAERPLVVQRHYGGALDWYSADADANQPLVPPAEVVPEQPVLPTPLHYPGAPDRRWWSIEDVAVDIGGYPPDTAHFATMLLVDLVYSHSDDWFLFPITAQTGQVVTVHDMVVTDSFGRTYRSDEARWAGLRSPNDWALFATVGLPPAALVLWTIAELPLESNPVERVQFGIDEQSNLLWAVEQTVDGRDVAFRRPASLLAQPVPLPPARPASALQAARHYQYVAGQGATPRWHPYLMAERDGVRRFLQYGLADLSGQRPVPLPRPEAETLRGGVPGQRTLHELAPAAIPAQGVEVERRWQLARDLNGRPILWFQRQRKPLRTPPARLLRFDVAMEVEATQG